VIARRALAVAAAAALPLAAAAGLRPAPGGAIRIGVPTAAAAHLLAERATSAPLLEVDARGALVPGALAEVPSPEVGGRAFRLRLRPGLADASGRPLGAADLAARLTASLSEPGASAALPILGAEAVLDGRAPLLAGVQVLSPVELLVTLAFPLPEFPWLLATPGAALRGAGPFVALPRRAAGDPLVLVANPHHHRGRPFAAELALHAVDPRSAARRLEQGGLELVLRPEGAGGRAGPPLPALAATVAVVNAARLGAAADPVRRALGSLDRAELARRFVRGPAEPLATLVPPAVLPGAPPGAPEGTARAAPLAPPRGDRTALRLVADGTAPDQRALAERVQVKLFDAGVRASLELVDGPRLAERLARGDHDVALLAVPVAAVRPALAAAEIVRLARGPAAALRAMERLAAREGEAALAELGRLAAELDLFPLVASGVRASRAPALQGLAPGADGAFDPGALWLIGGGAGR
jgi:peptide/nickel transport system substrate-binding protein